MRVNAVTLVLLIAVLALARPEKVGEILAVGIPASIFCLAFTAWYGRSLEAQSERKRERGRELDREIESLEAQVRELEGGGP